MHTIIEISDPEMKHKICFDVINTLPDWFGIPESNKAYAEQVKCEKFLAIGQDNDFFGFISAKKHNMKSAEITVMGIRSEFHKRGYGKLLIKTMEEILESEGIAYLSVKTLADTRECPCYERTRIFYRAMAFVELEIIPAIWGEDNPCLYMVKKLDI